MSYTQRVEFDYQVGTGNLLVSWYGPPYPWVGWGTRQTEVADAEGLAARWPDIEEKKKGHIGRPYRF